MHKQNMLPLSLGLAEHGPKLPNSTTIMSSSIFDPHGGQSTGNCCSFTCGLNRGDIASSPMEKSTPTTQIVVGFGSMGVAVTQHVHPFRPTF